MDEFKYLKAYARLATGIDNALTIMDTGNLLEFEYVRNVLQEALLDAEEIFIEELTEDISERS